MTSIPGILIPAFMLLTPVAPADTSTVFHLAIQAQGEEVATGYGVLIANELLLTNYPLIAQGDSYAARDMATGAQLAASVQAVDADSSMALLAVPGLSGDPATVAMEEPETGRRVHLLFPEGSQREGTLHSPYETPDGKVRYRFTAIVEEDEIGAPLMNNCGELLSVNAGNLSRPVVGDANLGVSGARTELVAFLNAQETDFQTSEEACLSLQEQLRQAAETEQEMEAERQRLEEEKIALEGELARIESASNEEQQQDEEQMLSLQARRDSLEERLQAQNEELSERELALTEQEQLQQDLEEQLEQQERERRQQEEEFTRRQTMQRSIGVGIGILFLIMIALLLLWMRARKRKMHESERELAIAKSQLERDRATFPDVVLIGEEPEEQEVRIKIDGNALARSESGQIIGRSAADANYVVGIDRISRRHARLRAENEILTIEDLNSLNGTRLDGVLLQPGEVHAVRDGGILTLGDVDFTVHFLR